VNRPGDFLLDRYFCADCEHTWTVFKLGLPETPETPPGEQA